MRAARFDFASKTLSVQDVPTPEPGPGEVLVKVVACGICHSDLTVMSGGVPTGLTAITPGHEISGTIAAFGGPTPGWEIGDAVVLHGGQPCGTCQACQHLPNASTCQNLQIMGVHRDGGWAEYVLAPVSTIIAAPRGVAMEQAAILADAVATPYGALFGTGGLRPAESVAIWGLGGLGVHTLQLARLAGAAPIIGLDPLPEARSRALDFGADQALDPTDPDVLQQLRDLTGGGVELAIDNVGSQHTVPQANAALRSGGRLVLVGLTPVDLNLGSELHFSMARHRVLGHLGYSYENLAELVKLTELRRLDLTRSVSAVFPLEDIHEGVRRLAEHDGNPIRIVIKP
ncbi:zinc-binding dehydrogenase [Nocardia altamirensis]|uniref:zinc-binding dehydrogenase n=1 Tax=Nocardia altamirensis TaxID=472158 RepID=UPI0008407D6C|nr:zinc-binding dehydrogenase [Nocardia altamirensis]